MRILDWFRKSKRARKIVQSECLSFLGEVGSGERVSAESAMRYSAFYAAVRVISEGVSWLPLKVYRRRADGGKDEVTDHPVHNLIQHEANPNMTAQLFRESRQAWVCTRGNGYAEIERNNGGQPIALWPVDADTINVNYDDMGRVVYEQGFGGRGVKIPAENMLHIPGLSFDGVEGLSVIEQARETLGEAIATQKAGASFWKNGSRAGGVLEHPGSLSDSALRRLRKQWNDRHAGAGNTGKDVILEEGMTYKALTIPPDDAQFLETRRFQVNDIARIFNIPPHMLGDMERATFSNIEQQSIDFVTNTLTPWLRRWENEIRRKLFTQAEKDAGYFVEHVVAARLRGDVSSRYNAYSVGRNGGWLSVNDIRRLENMDPVDGGDQYLAPLNMTTLDQLGQEPATRAHLNDSFTRLLAIESKAVKRAATKGEDIRGTYDSIRGKAAAILLPAVRAIRSDSAAFVDAFIDDYVSRQVEKLAQTGDIASAMDAWCEVGPELLTSLVIEQGTE